MIAMPWLNALNQSWAVLFLLMGLIRQGAAFYKLKIAKEDLRKKFNKIYFSMIHLLQFFNEQI